MEAFCITSYIIIQVLLECSLFVLLYGFKECDFKYSVDDKACHVQGFLFGGYKQTNSIPYYVTPYLEAVWPTVRILCKLLHVCSSVESF